MKSSRTVTVTLTLQTDVPMAELRKRSEWQLLMDAQAAHQDDDREVQVVKAEAHEKKS